MMDDRVQIVHSNLLNNKTYSHSYIAFIVLFSACDFSSEWKRLLTLWHTNETERQRNYKEKKYDEVMPIKTFPHSLNKHEVYMN